MSQPSSPATSDTTLQAVVLLNTPPRGVGAFLSRISPEYQRAVDEAPPLLDLDEMAATINGLDVRFRVGRSPMTDAGLARAVAVSPVRDLVAAAVDHHAGWIAVAIAETTDRLAAQQTLSGLVARIMGDQSRDATAVHLPHQFRITTDVLFVHEAAERPSQTWFWAPAMWRDDHQQQTVAFTTGLSALGGTELQVVTDRQEPAALFNAFRPAVCDVLETGTLPSAGAELSLSGTVHRVVLGTHAIYQTPVLELQPGAAPEEKPSRFTPFKRKR